MFKCILILAAAATVVFAQSDGKTPDLNGVWQAPYTPDLAKPLGRELPMNDEGLKHFQSNKKTQEANDPSSFCLPVGPARIIQAPMPFQIVQTPQLTTLLFEYQRAFRLIYTDGRPHPQDWDPEWYGDSVAKWEGDTLVVDTRYITSRTWLDTAGHEHSDDLHLTERFRKTAPDMIQWTATFEDPKYYSEPFTITLPLRKQNTRIMSYSCEENEKDRKEGHLSVSASK